MNSHGSGVILLIGGMGPMAGIQCYKYILENTLTNGTDQDNLDTVVVSYPQHIENRVDYILGKSDSNPGKGVFEFIQPFLKMLSMSYTSIFVGVPCVTFHCPPIFSVFREGVQNSYSTAEIISIIDCTVEFISHYHPTISRIGILSTDGTRMSKPFKSEMEAIGKTMVYLTDDQQKVVTDCIFNTQWGIKSSTLNKDFVHSLFMSIIDELLEEGCDAIILGCTEIPLVIEDKQYKGIPIFNPSWILSRKLIERVDSTKLVSCECE